MNDIARAQIGASYWLLVRNDHKGAEVLTTRLWDDQQALPVFSFQEEAEMFLCLRDSQDGWQVRESGTEELLSMLYTVLKDAEHVTLDPLPESSGLSISTLLSISRNDFMDRLERADDRCKEAEGDLDTAVFDDCQWLQRSG